jgi:hypothetical protein
MGVDTSSMFQQDLQQELLLKYLPHIHHSNNCSILSINTKEQINAKCVTQYNFNLKVHLVTELRKLVVYNTAMRFQLKALSGLSYLHHRYSQNFCALGEKRERGMPCTTTVWSPY